MKHIRFLFILLFLFLSFNAFAATYTVTEYKYTGDEKKTTDFALDNMVNPHTEEVFYDLQSLNNALKAKQQVLWNTTLFSKVEVTYEIISSVDENNSVGINVYVEDAGSSFAFPYPKYDSNYGLIFGLRYKEKNLFGLMASFDASLDVKQQDNSFLKGEYVFDLPVTGLRIKNLSFSAGLSGIVDLLNTERSYIRFLFDNDNWQVGTADITAQIDAKYYYDNTSASDFDINVSEKDLVLGPGILDLGFGFRFKPENTPVVNYYK